MTGTGGERSATETGTGDGDGDGDGKGKRFMAGVGDERWIFLIEAIPESRGSISGLALTDRI